ncbi:MAG: thiamine biosynthesis protein ThiC [Pseudomonadota bacterium]
MEFTLKRTVQITGLLLIAAAVTQAIYTALYVAELDVPRQLLWGLEGLLFVLLAAFAGSALSDSKRYSLGYSAIAMSAVLNVVQVGVGLTMFGPFREVATEIEATAPAAGAIVAFSFMVYNAAKVLLALAAIVFGMARMNGGAKTLGGLTALVGVVALVANTLSMALGRGFMGEIPLAGGSGVLATLLLALCLLKLPVDQD